MNRMTASKTASAVVAIWFVAVAVFSAEERAEVPKEAPLGAVNLGGANLPKKKVDAPSFAVEIQLNVKEEDTADDDADDYVCLTNAPGLPSIRCRAKLKKALTAAMTVVLKNMSGGSEVRFPGNTDTTKMLTLSQNGTTWTYFDISGVVLSSSKDDAKIEAREGTAEGTKVGEQELTVLKVDIEEPDGLPVQSIAAGDSRFRLNPSCFEWQFVHVTNEVVTYHTTQPIDGLVERIPPAGYSWSVSKGTLNNPTAETPTYVPNETPMPTTMTTVDLKLRPISGSDACLQTRTLEVYRDHLERDYQNWGTGIECGAETAYTYYWSFSRYGQGLHLLHTWNCFGSVWHAFDGTKDGYTTTIPSSGFTVTTEDDPILWSTAVANLKRGDIVSFYTYDSSTDTETLQHAHTCMGSASQMYGANNEPVYGAYARQDNYGHHASYWEGGSWRWWMTSSETYYNRINADYQRMNPEAGKLINRIKVHRR